MNYSGILCTSRAGEQITSAAVAFILGTTGFLESLFGGSSRGAQLLVYPWPKTGPPLSGMVVVFDQAHSFGRDAHGAVREEGDTHLASQICRINPGDQWGDRCHNQIALRSWNKICDWIQKVCDHSIKAVGQFTTNTYKPSQFPLSFIFGRLKNPINLSRSKNLTRWVLSWECKNSFLLRTVLYDISCQKIT